MLLSVGNGEKRLVMTRVGSRSARPLLTCCPGRRKGVFGARWLVLLRGPAGRRVLPHPRLPPVAVCLCFCILLVLSRLS